MVSNNSLMERIKTFLNLIKFEHSIFALPFAYLGLFIAANGLPSFRIFFWVTAAMVLIRTVAMCLNRLIDEPIDQKNPRTKDRIKAIQKVKRTVVQFISIVALILFIYSASQINELCFKLSPIAVFLIWLYPHLKKFTWFSHFVLGIILGIAPYAGWLAVSNEWSWMPILLTIAVASWVSGFDIFYALQDVEFDHREGLKSFPVRFGTAKTLIAVRVFHTVTLVSLIIFGLFLRMSFWYWIGWSAAALLIIREHNLVARFGLKKINEAFFNMNAWVSVILFVFTALDLTFHF